jgi:two-component sensor histidine kinase
MTPLVVERIHLLLECSACIFALGALVLLWHGHATRPSTQDSREDAILEHAKTQEALLREVNHRVRNDFTSLIGLLQMKRDYARSPEEAGHLKDMEARLSGLAAIHNMLSLNGWRPVGLGELCRVLIHKSTDLAGVPCEITVTTVPGDVMVPPSQGHHLTLIINELISNAIRHGRQLNRTLAIRVRIDTLAGDICLAFSDNGTGYPEAILRNPSCSPGAGLQIIRDLATLSLNGRFTVSHDNGAVASIAFPRQTIPVEVVPS